MTIPPPTPPTPGLDERIRRETERKRRVDALGELHRLLHVQRWQVQTRLNDEALPESIRTQGRAFVDNALESFMWTLETMIRREQDG